LSIPHRLKQPNASPSLRTNIAPTPRQNHPKANTTTDYPVYFPAKLIVKYSFAGKIQHFCAYTDKVIKPDKN
jgi:hypothetical protein